MCQAPGLSLSSLSSLSPRTFRLSVPNGSFSREGEEVEERGQYLSHYRCDGLLICWHAENWNMEDNRLNLGSLKAKTPESQEWKHVAERTVLYPTLSIFWFRSAAGTEEWRISRQRMVGPLLIRSTSSSTRLVFIIMAYQQILTRQVGMCHDDKGMWHCYI